MHSVHGDVPELWVAFGHLSLSQEKMCPRVDLYNIPCLIYYRKSGNFRAKIICFLNFHCFYFSRLNVTVNYLHIKQHKI